MTWINMQIDDTSLSRKDIGGRKEKQANEKNGKVIKEGRKKLSSYKVTFLVDSLRALSSRYGEERFEF